MSINITVHGNPRYSGKRKSILLDSDRAKKQEFEDRRKQRLEQVRKQSNELASQLRRNVEKENKKQIERINQLKRDELHQWREKARLNTENELERTLADVGLAHRAAEQENEKLRPCPISDVRNLAIKSKKKDIGKSKIKSLTPKKHKKTLTDHRKSNNKKLTTNTNTVNDENSSNIANIPTKKASPERSPILTKVFSKAKKQEENGVICESSSSSSREHSPKLNVKKQNYVLPTKKPRNKSTMIQTPSVIMEINSESDTSILLDIDDDHDSSNMRYSRIASKHTPRAPKISKKNRKKDEIEENSFVPMRSMQRPMRFTQISDLVMQKCHDEDLRRISPGRCEKTKTRGQRTRSTSISPRRITSPPSSPRKPKSTPSSPKKYVPCPPRPPCMKSDKISIKSSISRSDPSSQQGNRVQFYDYGNKFEKQYNAPSVVHPERNICGLNAMERAKIEAELQECRQKELELNRQKSDERCQRALEKERIRKDYEALTAKLDAICNDKIQKQLNSDDAYLYSHARMKNIANEREKKLNSEIETILNRPVIITCPEVRKTSSPPKKHSDPLRHANSPCLNVGAEQRINDNSITLNSSDSCASILLNYVSNQTKQVSEDIASCDNKQKIKRLQALLDRINRLREKLLNELKNYEEVPYSTEHIQEIVDSVEAVQKERDNIMLDKTVEDNEDDRSKKKREDLEKREKLLKKKEAILENKLKDFFKANKAKESVGKLVEKSSSLEGVASLETDDDAGSETLASKKIVAEKPVEIVIKVKSDQRRKKSLFKSPRKRPTGLAQAETTKKKKESPVKEIVQEDNGKRLGPLAPQKIQQDEGSSMTSYRSFPDQIQNVLNRLLTEKLREEKIKNSQASRVEQVDRIPTRKPKLSKPVVMPKTNENPQIKHYIERLLGMSHHAIEMLAVSTSEMETPSSSVVNNSANVSTTDSELLEKNKIDQVKKFLQDSYNFINQIDESMKKDTSTTSGSNDSSLKTIEEIWKQILKQNHLQKENKVKEIQQIKPILKKSKTPAVVVVQTPPSPPTVEPSKTTSQTLSKPPEKESFSKDIASTKKLELLGQYNNLAENCNQRIAELNEMIVKVREEKQKILEITLSSGGETARTSTEYADFCDPNAVEKSESIKLSDKKTVSPIRSPEKVALEKNKVTGMSRDSGISMSRPVTALDTRESPEIPSNQEDFEPILKDIPKPSVPIVQIIPPPSYLTEAEAHSSRSKKPPTSLGRYSPQFGEEVPHELSTIIEVDTPGTSRINTSAREVEGNIADGLVEIGKNIVYQKFPSFEEYAKQKNLDLTKFDEDTISQIQVEYEGMINTFERSQERSIGSGGASTSNEIKNLVESMKLFHLSFKKFPTRKEYLEQMGMTDSIESRSMETSLTAETQNENLSKADESSDESLMDVVEELKRRKMIKNSFQNEISETHVERKTPEDDDTTVEPSSTTSEPHCSKTVHSKKTKRHSLKHSKERNRPRIEETGFSGVEAMQTSSQSQSDSIVKDLNELGLTWAATMMKKSHEHRKARDLSSTSSDIHYPLPKKKSPRKPVDVLYESTEYEGQPLNLREFLAREIQRRTASSSILSSDGSVTTNFLRSLLGSSTSSSSGERSREMKSSDRVKTSTPINLRSSSQSPNPTYSQNFFSGDSRPSSVQHNTNSSGSRTTTSSSGKNDSNSNHKPIS